MLLPVGAAGSAFRAGKGSWWALQASERVGSESKEEAALYGVLAGNVGRVLPLCASWEDATWALTRR